LHKILRRHQPAKFRDRLQYEIALFIGIWFGCWKNHGTKTNSSGFGGRSTFPGLRNKRIEVLALPQSNLLQPTSKVERL